MRKFSNVITVGIGVSLQLASVSTSAQTVAYTDETSFLNALAAQGYVPVQEGFEDDAAWGAVRSTIPGGQHTAPSVTHLGVTWSSSSMNNEITTGPGPARTGNWGFYSLPHGDYENAIGDGWIGSTTEPLVAIGGWVESNTPPAKLGLYLDGFAVDFNGMDALNSQHQFFGAINPQGFTQFLFLELEGTLNDQKLMFADDFTFAFGGELLDCNLNSTADPLDIANGTSLDCNHNLVPDECEIDINSGAPGGPFYCVASCDADCNQNGVPDICDATSDQQYASGQLSPIGNGSPQSFTIFDAPVARSTVVLSLTAYANLGGGPDWIDVYLNGNFLGQTFAVDGSDCPEGDPDTAQLLVSAEDFNIAVTGGDALFEMVATAEVNPTECDFDTYVSLDVLLPVSSSADTNGDGIPDECQQAVIPAVTHWGALAMALLVLIAGTTVFGKACRA